MMKTGIVSYGTYVPKYRLSVSEIASVWGKNAEDIEKILGVKEKAVAANDEDTVTLAFEAGKEALREADISASRLQTCFVGSESHPYAVNPTSTIVAEFLGIGRNYYAFDLEFACKAATSGMIVTSGLINSGIISTGLVIGSDTAQAKPHDVLEYTAASGAAAFILGKSNEKTIADIVSVASYSSDTPDFWRRDGVRYPSHGGRFTGEPAYFSHVIGVAKILLEKTNLKPSDFSYCVFHMPNGKFPREVAKRLGFTNGQLVSSLIVDKIGNPYSASSLLGLASVLNIAKPNQLIFMVSYGSGAGSDGFVLKTTNFIGKKRKKVQLLQEISNDKKYISYLDYLKFGRKI